MSYLVVHIQLLLICHLQEHQRLHGKNMYFSSAQLTTQHAKEEVNGKTVLAVANFPRKQIGPRMSDCLITGVQVDSDDVATRTASTVLVECSHAVQAGLLVTVTGNTFYDEYIKTIWQPVCPEGLSACLCVTDTHVDMATCLRLSCCCVVSPA